MTQTLCDTLRVKHSLQSCCQNIPFLPLSPPPLLPAPMVFPFFSASLPVFFFFFSLKFLLPFRKQKESDPGFRPALLSSASSPCTLYNVQVPEWHIPGALPCECELSAPKAAFLPCHSMVWYAKKFKTLMDDWHGNEEVNYPQGQSHLPGQSYWTGSF